MHDVAVSRHDPEDFVVHFRHAEDRACVHTALAVGALLSLVWRPWR
jgi:hypothetical protein